MTSKALIKKNNMASLEKLLIHGDLSAMDETHRLQYVKALCKLTGISILARPFDYIKLQGRTVLYANRAAAEQLRSIHKISINITAREHINGLYVVTARARTGKGKEDEAIGAVNCKGLMGEALANSMMKAETKAKRRVTLSICGLGMLDEIEAKQIADQESKIATELAVEETHAKLDATQARPEFEGVNIKEEPASPSLDQPTHYEYVLKAGRIKGKTLKQVPLKKLADWMKWFNEQQNSGKQLNEDIQDDAFHIHSFLEEAQTSLPLDEHL